MPKTLGDVLPFSVSVTDANGAAASAGTMTITVTRPDGTAEPGSPFTIVDSPTGTYEKLVTSAQVGLYTAYWLGTGLNAGADESQVFYVRSSAAQWFVSLDDAKSHCNIPLTTTTHDEELKWMLGAAATTVEYFCGPVLRREYEDEVTGGRAEIPLWHDQVLELTSVTPIMSFAPAVTIADLDVGATGMLRHTGGLPISSGPLRVVYTAGRTEIPDALYGAALIMVKHNWETQRGPGRPGVLGQQVGGQGAGDVTFLPVQGFAIPSRAKDLMNLHPAPAGIA